MERSEPEWYEAKPAVAEGEWQTTLGCRGGGMEVAVGEAAVAVEAGRRLSGSGSNLLALFAAVL